MNRQADQANLESPTNHQHHGDAHDHSHGHGEGHDHDHSHDAEQQSLDQRFFFLLGIVIMGIWGGVMVYFYTSGRITAYLTGDGAFRIQTLIAGLGLFVVGLFNFFMRKRDVDCGHNHGSEEEVEDESAGGHAHHCCSHSEDPAAGGHGHAHSHAGSHAKHDHDHGHSHDHEHHHHHEEDSIFGRIVAVILLVVPVTAAAALSPDQFSEKRDRAQIDSVTAPAVVGNAPKEFDLAKDVAGSSKDSGVAETPSDPDAFSLEDLKKLVPTSAEGNLQVKVVELFYTAGDVEIQRVISGQPVETIGRVVPDKVNNPNNTRLRVFEMVMECCAADARPFSIPVEFGKTPPDFREMGWYKVIGTMDYQMEGGVMVPVLEATDLRPTKAPANKIF